MDGPDGDLMGSRAAQARRLPCSSLPLGETPSASNLSQQPRRPTSCMDGTPPWKTFGTRARGVESSTSPDRAPEASAASPRNALGLPEPARRPATDFYTFINPGAFAAPPPTLAPPILVRSDTSPPQLSLSVSLSRPCNSRAVLVWNEMKWPPPAPRLDIA